MRGFVTTKPGLGIESTNAVPFTSTTSLISGPESPKSHNTFISGTPSNSQGSSQGSSYERQRSDNFVQDYFGLKPKNGS